MTHDEDTQLRGRGQLRALVVDYDGTLTSTGHLSPAVRDALTGLRARGVRVVLATGRIVDDLLAEEPGVTAVVDLVVAENGGVLWRDGHQHPLVGPVAAELGTRLAGRHVAHRVGHVLLACRAADEVAVSEEVRDLGEEYQLIRNRAELMVLPAGVTKGTGATAALAELGLSPHNALALGDAENDHSMFDACEVGVAVADAVDSLRRHADLVLEGPDGDGVVDLLTGPLLSGQGRLLPRRWRISLGDDADGPVTVPASQINLLVAGGSGSGKSYTAGLLTEQLVHLGYSVLVIDPEGDHRGLGSIPGVTITGREDGLLPPDLVVRLLRPQGGGVVVDLSTTPTARQEQYLRALWAELEAHRAITGLPHWVVIDEAQLVLGALAPGQALFDVLAKGHLLVTWRAGDLPAGALASVDVVVAVGEPGESQSTDVAAAVAGVERSQVPGELAGRAGSIVVARRWHPGRLLRCSLPSRSTEHRRHDHKYERTAVGEAERFWLWRPPGSEQDERTIAGLAELEAELAACPPSVIVHHSRHGDFSRWIADVIGSEALSRDVGAVEATLAVDDPSPTVVETARVRLLALLQGRTPAR